MKLIQVGNRRLPKVQPDPEKSVIETIKGKIGGQEKFVNEVQ